MIAILKKHKRLVRNAFIALYSASILLFGSCCGDIISSDRQAELYGSLSTIAGVIFGVMGAWVAIIYPDSLKSINERNNKNSIRYLSTISHLRTSILISTIILAIYLVGSPVVSVIVKFDSYQHHKTWFLRASFCLLLILASLQFWSVILSLVPLGFVESTVADAVDKSKSREGILSGLQNDENQESSKPDHLKE